MMPQRKLFVGCAGWSIPAADRATFPTSGSQLERYSAVFPAVEINSSFYRPHRATTYARWANSVPDDFRFSVKVPKAITHGARLAHVERQVAEFVEECSHLGQKLGCLLLQLPPSLKWNADLVTPFVRIVRQFTEVDICCEPRHPSWTSDDAIALLKAHRVTLVSADPSPFPNVDVPQSLGSINYYRLHGSPRMYYSSYSPEFIEQLAVKLREPVRGDRSNWCIFDNTAAGAATQNALTLLSLLTSARQPA